MGKYSRLGEFLRSQRSKEVPLTFAEIERIIGDKLPPNSPNYPAWWSNNPTNNVMTKVWLDAGFRTEQVDVRARKVVFRRVESEPMPEADSPTPTRTPVRAPPSQHGKLGDRHPLFGALKGLMRLKPGT